MPELCFNVVDEGRSLVFIADFKEIK
jgi:hypothetical protein